MDNRHSRQHNHQNQNLVNIKVWIIFSWTLKAVVIICRTALYRLPHLSASPLPSLSPPSRRTESYATIDFHKTAALSISAKSSNDEVTVKTRHNSNIDELNWTGHLFVRPSSAWLCNLYEVWKAFHLVSYNIDVFSFWKICVIKLSYQIVGLDLETIQSYIM